MEITISVVETVLQRIVNIQALVFVVVRKKVEAVARHMRSTSCSVRKLHCAPTLSLSSVIKTDASLKLSGEEEKGAVLQIMKIPALRPNGRDPPFEVELWDIGSTNHHVRMGHAEKMGFSCRREGCMSPPLAEL